MGVCSVSTASMALYVGGGLMLCLPLCGRNIGHVLTPKGLLALEPSCTIGLPRTGEAGSTVYCASIMNVAPYCNLSPGVTDDWAHCCVKSIGMLTVNTGTRTATPKL